MGQPSLHNPGTRNAAFQCWGTSAGPPRPYSRSPPAALRSPKGMNCNPSPSPSPSAPTDSTLHRPSDRPHTHALHLYRSKLFQTLLFCSLLEQPTAPHTIRTSRCTILAPPWFKDRATTFRPTHSRGNPFLSPFLLPNLSRLCITAHKVPQRVNCLPDRQPLARNGLSSPPPLLPSYIASLRPLSHALALGALVTSLHSVKVALAVSGRHRDCDRDRQHGRHHTIPIP